MPPRSQPPLALPDLRFSRVKADTLTTEQQELRAHLQQSNEKLIQEHLRELKKRINASIAALPADLKQFRVWRRVRFDGVHLVADWSEESKRYYWLEPVWWNGQYPFLYGHLIDCAERLPPIGWSRWIYYHEFVSASKFFRVEWDIREGEMLEFFEYWNGESLMHTIQAAEAIEESRVGNKRLTAEQRAASPLQLCIAWDLEEVARARQKTQLQMSWEPTTGPPYRCCFTAQSLGQLRFTDGGHEIVEPLCFTPGEMMLLSKHEVCVLSKHPHLKRFIFSRWGAQDDWAELVDKRRRQRKEERDALNRRRKRMEECDEVSWDSDSDPESQYRQSDMRDMQDEIEVVDVEVDATQQQQLAVCPIVSPHEPAGELALPIAASATLSTSSYLKTDAVASAIQRGTGIRRRRLDESLVTEASSVGSSAAEATMEED